MPHIVAAPATTATPVRSAASCIEILDPYFFNRILGVGSGYTHIRQSTIPDMWQKPLLTKSPRFYRMTWTMISVRDVITERQLFGPAGHGELRQVEVRPLPVEPHFPEPPPRNAWRSVRPPVLRRAAACPRLNHRGWPPRVCLTRDRTRVARSGKCASSHSVKSSLISCGRRRRT